MISAPREYVVLFSTDEGQELIRRHCERIGIHVADLHELIEEIVDKDSMGRRAGLWAAFEEILGRSITEHAPE